MSFVPAVHKLTLSDFEVIVVKRFEAMAAGSDQSVSNALRDLPKSMHNLKPNSMASKLFLAKLPRCQPQNAKQSRL